MSTTEGNKRALDEFMNSHQLNDPLSIDNEYFEVNYLGDQDLVRDMITMFVNNTPLLLSNIRSAFDEGDLKQLYQSVHKIKPTFTMVGLQKVSAICEYIESYVRNEDEVKDAKLLADFISLLEKKAEESLILGKKYLNAN